MTTKIRATIDDLYKVPENRKAEIVDGKLILMSPTGARPGRAASEIYISLRECERTTKQGYAIPDNVGFVVDLPDRDSFSPDAAFHVGDEPDMEFIHGAPVFAVEVRSENDYGPKAEQALAKKRADYFAAGTLIVWDVDLLSPDVIRSYDSRNPDMPRIFRRDDTADAEPAVPGWRMRVDDLFS
ncbi:MAG TPA: Uma2 family endonuclease [Blastocatellia bacterium]|nr:Uma2 family endonuclease [Blastocatellia bacterium]